MENFTNETPVVEETTILEETPVVEKVEATVEPNTEAPAEKSKLFGILSLVCSLMTFATCCYGGVPFGIAAIIFSSIDKKKNGASSGLGKAGLIIGIIGIVLGGIIIVLAAIGGAASSVLTDSYSSLYY